MSKIRISAWLDSSFFLACRWQFSYCVLTWQKTGGRGRSGEGKEGRAREEGKVLWCLFL